MNAKITAWLLATSVVLGGCDYVAEKEMKVGEATQEEVMTRMGQPTHIWPEPDGGKTLEMSRQPEGSQTYQVKISPDGKYLGMRNVLVDSMFEQVKPGMTPEQVRRLIGPPALKQEFKLKKETAQSYRFAPSPGRTEMFDVYYDLEGKVIRTGKSPDQRNNQTN
jgi:hypothetical protein